MKVNTFSFFYFFAGLPNAQNYELAPQIPESNNYQCSPEPFSTDPKTLGATIAHPPLFGKQLIIIYYFHYNTKSMLHPNHGSAVAQW